ncbi:TetR/AcrR family transcriptional regulator [Jiulongibacter sp. NS-SX5]|uniref:TetR/AcrR family transcriptional regulator n=1 Tax=Jiulongibacter sp. NS-SX5 TaxID=3463854 RepID=UPI0040583385
MPKVKMFDKNIVLNKAIQLFWLKGYFNTSMQDLVDYLEINRASIYDTYGNKRELFLLAFKNYINSNNKSLVEFLEKENSTKLGLLNLLQLPIEASFCENGNKGCFAVNTATEMLPKDDEIRDILRDNRLELESIFYSHLKRGFDNGELSSDKDIQELASFLYTLLNGILVIAKVNPDKRYLINILKTGLTVLD